MHRKKLCIGKKYSFAVFLFLISNSVAYSYAKDEADSTGGQDGSKESMMIVTASAGGNNQSVKQAPASVTSITNNEVLRKPYRDVSDLLEGVPGLTTSVGGDHKEINIRGMGPEYTAYMIDGMRIDSRDINRLFDGYGQMNAWIPPALAIDHIEAIRGPMSSIYGSDAMGGIVNIITRKNSKFWQGSIGTNFDLQQHKNTGNIFQNDFFVTGPLIENILSFQAYGNYSKRDEDNIYNGYRGSKRENLTGKVTYTPTANQEISFTSNHTQQDIFQKVGKSISPECTYYSGCPSDYRKKTEVDRFSVNHIGYWSFGKTESYVQREDYSVASQNVELKNLNIHTSLTSNISNHILSLGGEVSIKSLHDGISNQLSDISNLKRTEKSLFLEDSWLATEDFTVTSGVRFDDDNQFGTHWSPRLYGVWNIGDYWTIKGGISTGFKAPSITETSSNFGTITYIGNLYGNPDLKPEKSVTQELGLLYDDNAGLSGGVTLFNNDFKDKIDTILCPVSQCIPVRNMYGAYPITYKNIGKAVTRGVETYLNVPVSEKISLENSFTYTYSKQQTGQNKGKPLNKLPKYQFSSTANYQYNEQVKSWLRVNFRGQDSNNVGGSLQTIMPIRAPSFALFDIGLDVRVMKNLNARMGVSNLFDKKIRYDNFGFTEDGRNYWAGLTYSF